MFYPCPHCQFLVTHHPQLRPLPADCPRCGRPLQEDVPATGDERAGDATVVPTGADADAEAGTDVSQDVDQDAALAAFSVDAGAAQPVEDDPDDRDPPPVASVANDSPVVDAAGQPAPHADFSTQDGRAPAAFAGTARGSRWLPWLNIAVAFSSNSNTSTASAGAPSTQIVPSLISIDRTISIG